MASRRKPVPRDNALQHQPADPSIQRYSLSDAPMPHGSVDEYHDDIRAVDQLLQSSQPDTIDSALRLSLNSGGSASAA
ncbi:hypothetical protein C0993_000508, partial [Termitomyces sp. T159_Od127]